MSQPKPHHYASHRSTKSLDRVAIFWDYESCRPGPGYIPAYTIVDNIRNACLSYGSITTFKAYVERADTTESSRPPSLHHQQSHSSLHDQLQLYGVGLCYYPPSMRSTVGERLLLVDMLLFALDNPAPATTLIIITAEEILPYAISALRLRHYKVVLITPQSAGVNPYPKPAVAAHASEVLDWTSVVSRGRRSPTNTNTGGSSTGTGGTGTSTAATGNDGGSPRSVSTVDSLPLSPTMTPAGTSSSSGTVVEAIVPRPISTSSRGSTHHRPHHQGYQPHQSYQAHQSAQPQAPQQSSFLQSQTYQPHHQHSLSSSSTSSVLTNPLSPLNPLNITNPTPLFPSFASTFQPFRRGLTPQLGTSGAGPTTVTGAQSTFGRVWGHSGFPSSSSISFSSGLGAGVGAGSVGSADRDRDRDREQRERERERAREREIERLADRDLDREPRRANSGSTIGGSIGGQPTLNLDTNNPSHVTAGPPSSISNTSSTSSSLSSLTSPQSIPQSTWPLSPPPTIQHRQTPLSGVAQSHPHSQQHPQLPHSQHSQHPQTPHQHLQHQQSREFREQKEQRELQAQREREQAQKEQPRRERGLSFGPIAPPISPTDSIVRRPTATGTGTGPTTTPSTAPVTGFQFMPRISPPSFTSFTPQSQQQPQQSQQLTQQPQSQLLPQQQQQQQPPPLSQPQMPQMQMPQPQPHPEVPQLSHGQGGFSAPFGFGGSGGRTGSRDDTGPALGMNLNQPYPPNIGSVGSVGGFSSGPTVPATRPPHYTQSSHGSQSGHGSFGSISGLSGISGHASSIDMQHFDLLLNILREFRADNKPRPYRSKIGSELVQRDRLVYQRAGLSGFKEYVGIAEQLGLVRLGGHSGSPGKEWIELVVPPPTATAPGSAPIGLGDNSGVVSVGTGGAGGGANS